MSKIKIAYTVFPNGHVCKYDLVKEEMDSLWYWNKFGMKIYAWFRLGKEETIKE